MKRLVVVVLALAFVFALISCGGGSPKATVQEFIDKAKSGNVDSAMQLCRKADQEAFKEIKTMMDELKKKDSGAAKDFDLGEALKKQTANVSLGNETVEGDKATVEITAKDEKGADKKDKIELVKEDGKWVINMKLDQAVAAVKQLKQMSEQMKNQPDQPDLKKVDIPETKDEGKKEEPKKEEPKKAPEKK
ncbi:MAG: DUF4878 domain-containing protein [Candidatus Coatesbacteria bacterium]|nr:DUF4878 domain-containing protein [Candidatus Coatesbacteria bacterium]